MKSQLESVDTGKEKIEQLIDQYSSVLLNRAIYLLSDKEDAKDIVQDVFLAAYSGFQSFKGNSSIKTWLHTILKNKIADYYRVKYKSPINLNLNNFFDQTGSWKYDETILEAWDEAKGTGESAEFDRLLTRILYRKPTS